MAIIDLKPGPVTLEPVEYNAFREYVLDAITRIIQRIMEMDEIVKEKENEDV